jgi:hypothetical protein
MVVISSDCIGEKVRMSFEQKGELLEKKNNVHVVKGNVNNKKVALPKIGMKV